MTARRAGPGAASIVAMSLTLGQQVRLILTFGFLNVILAAVVLLILPR